MKTKIVLFILAALNLAGCTGPQIQQDGRGGFQATAGFSWPVGGPVHGPQPQLMQAINDADRFPGMTGPAEPLAGYYQLPPERPTGVWASIKAAPVNYLRRLETKPISTLLYSAAAFLTASEVTGSGYSWSDLADEFSGGSKNDGTAAPAPNTITADNGASLTIRGASQDAFTSHSIRASGKDTNVLVDFDEPEDAPAAPIFQP